MRAGVDPWSGVADTPALAHLRRVKVAMERYQRVQRRCVESLQRLAELDVRLVPPAPEPGEPWLSPEQLAAIVAVEESWTAMIPALREYDGLLRSAGPDTDPPT